MVKIYTKTGDGGDTGIGNGKRVSKNSPRIAVIGDLDELSSQLGLCNAYNESDLDDDLLKDILEDVQRDLFHLGADLTLYKSGKDNLRSASRGLKPVGSRVGGAEVKKVESWIDTLSEKVPPLTKFILPGGSILAANFHLARAVCRRAERSLVALSIDEKVDGNFLVYLNRLSDLLFVMGRFVNVEDGVKEDIL